jgi:hypothetical protein
LLYETAFKDYSNVHIFSGHEAPSTFELLATCDYHTSIHSTCHYEALGLGKPTIVLPFTNYERMLPLCEKSPDCALLAKTPGDMNKIISKNRTVSPEIAGYYFREGAVNNILNELRQELSLPLNYQRQANPK